jgi:hypothetical protein
MSTLNFPSPQCKKIANSAGADMEQAAAAESCPTFHLPATDKVEIRKPLPTYHPFQGCLSA